MKKTIQAAVLLVMCLCLTGCGRGNLAAYEASGAADRVKELQLQDGVEMTTDNGTLRLQIHRVVSTDWAQTRLGRNDCRILLIEGECENVSYQIPQGKTLELDRWIRVKDSEGYQLSAPAVILDSGLYQMDPAFSQGEKGRVCLPYYAPLEEDSLTIDFNGCGTRTVTAQKDETQWQDLQDPEQLELAIKKAEGYSFYLHMSREAIYRQLTSDSENFSEDVARNAVDQLDADWNENALITAREYQSRMNLTEKSLYEYLVSPLGGYFTPDQAQYAVDQLKK